MEHHEPRKVPSLHLPVAKDRQKVCRNRCHKPSLTGPLHTRFPDKVHPRFLLPVGKFIESRPVQFFFTILFILDIAIVLTELILETEVKKQELALCELNCTVEEHARSVDLSSLSVFVYGREEPLGNSTEGGGGGGESGHDSVCHNDESLLLALETAEQILRYTSFGILSVFALELVTLMVVFNIYFFLHIFYVLDVVVVGATLGLEIGLRSAVSSEVAGVIIFLRLWRLVRAGHGVLTLEGEHVSELKMKIRRNARKYAKLQSDAHEYELEVLSLEALLEANGICHPEFSNQPQKFHKTADNHYEVPEDALEPGEREMINKWLAEAVAANKERVLRMTKTSELRQSLVRSDAGPMLRKTQEKALPADPLPMREESVMEGEERRKEEEKKEGEGEGVRVELDPLPQTNDHYERYEENSDSFEDFLAWKKTHH